MEQFGAHLENDGWIEKQLQAVLKETDQDLSNLQDLVINNDNKLEAQVDGGDPILINDSHAKAILSESIKNKDTFAAIYEKNSAGVVFAIQKLLVSLASTSQQYQGILPENFIIDGLYGEQTKTFVKNFQKKWNENHEDDKILIDGWAGKETIEKILSIDNSNNGTETSSSTNELELLSISNGYINIDAMPDNIKKNPLYSKWISYYKSEYSPGSSYSFKPRLVQSGSSSKIYLFATANNNPVRNEKATDAFIDGLPDEQLTEGLFYSKVLEKMDEFVANYNTKKLESFDNRIFSHGHNISFKELGIQSDKVKKFIQSNSYFIRNQRLVSDDYKNNPTFNLTRFSQNGNKISFLYDMKGPQRGNNRKEIILNYNDILDADGFFDEHKFKHRVGKALENIVDNSN